MGRRRSKEYPDYVTAVLCEGRSVREEKGVYYLYERKPGSSKLYYCGRIATDSTIVRRNKKSEHVADKPSKIDDSSLIESLLVKDYLKSQTVDYEFGFSHFILKICERKDVSLCLPDTDKCTILVEIIKSISPDSYLVKHPTELKRRHCFPSRKRELIRVLGKMGIHVQETYDLLKTIRIYEVPGGRASISKVDEKQTEFLAKWNVAI